MPVFPIFSMCGISGFIDYQRSSTSFVLQEMTDALHHRGPDAGGYETFETPWAQAGLGHRRLSIIDLSPAGNQPMYHEHLCIVFNGEIYNYKEVRKKLEPLGHTFKTQSDTEVILHAYAQWSESCVKEFIGMFAFVIYDAEKHILFCARDRAGVKPFFYYWHNGLFLFASELKAFHKHPRFHKELNLNAAAAFMQFGNIPAPHCIFHNCYKLKPGHILQLGIRTKQLGITEYWDVYDAYNKPKLDISFNEAKIETESVLKTAFDYRTVSDVPLGVFLSGGYDSACLTALLQKDRTQKIKTFTIGVPDIGLNEAPYAREVAKRLGTEHTEFNCTQKEALELIGSLPYHYDEPFGDSSAIPTTLVCRLARKQVTVALSADAGDEVFAGYNRYDYLMKHGRFLNQLPKALRVSTSLLMKAVPADKIPYFSGRFNFHNRYEKLRTLLQDPSPRNMMHSLSKQFHDKELSALFKQEIHLLETAYTSSSLEPEHYTPLSYVMAIDYQTYLVDDILQKVDRASMSSSLEAREPFLDHHVIEWAAQLPDSYKYHQGIKKYILRQIVHHYLPKELMDRPKMGFAIPLEKWMMSDLKQQVLHYLSDTRIEKQGFFEPAAVKKMREGFFSGRKELAVKIWYLLMFQMWHEKWME